MAQHEQKRGPGQLPRGVKTRTSNVREDLFARLKSLAFQCCAGFLMLLFGLEIFLKNEDLFCIPGWPGT